MCEVWHRSQGRETRSTQYKPPGCANEQHHTPQHCWLDSVCPSPARPPPTHPTKRTPSPSPNYPPTHPYATHSQHTRMPSPGPTHPPTTATTTPPTLDECTRGVRWLGALRSRVTLKSIGMSLALGIL